MIQCWNCYDEIEFHSKDELEKCLTRLSLVLKKRTALNDIKRTSKCIPDRVLNYLQYGIKKLNVTNDKETAKLMEAYKLIRLEFAEKGIIEVTWQRKDYSFIETCGEPKTTAASLLYLSLHIYEHETSQLDIAEIYDMAVGTIRKNYRILQQFLINNDFSWFEEKKC